MRVRRHLLIAAVFLLAGAVVNLAVAWGVAIRVAAPNPRTAITDREGLYVNQHTGDQWWCQVTRISPGHTRVVLEHCSVITRKNAVAYSGDVVVEMRVETTVESKLYHTWRSRKLLAWVQEQGVDLNKLSAGDPAETAKWVVIRERSQPVHLLTQVLQLHPDTLDPIELDAVPRWIRNPIRMFSSGQIHTACGWPLLSFRCEEALGPALTGRTLKVFGGCLLPDAFQSLGPGRVLPFRLIASGFAVNTVFYAVALWLLIYGPFALRRFIRAKRGLCSACAYPCGASAVCSECGTPATPSGVFQQELGESSQRHEG